MTSQAHQLAWWLHVDVWTCRHTPWSSIQVNWGGLQITSFCWAVVICWVRDIKVCCQIMHAQHHQFHILMDGANTKWVYSTSSSQNAGIGSRVSKFREPNCFSWNPIFEQLVYFSQVVQAQSLSDVYTLFSLFYRIFLSGIILNVIRLKEATNKVSSVRG